jgi:hypothetical protein
MIPLVDFLAQTNEITIHTLIRYIEQYIAEQWQSVLQESHKELLYLYDQAGEGAAYGTYAQRLFRPVQEQLKRAGFHSNFPGTLSASREWGPPDKRERWMWSVVYSPQSESLGTTVIIYFHDHTQFRIPQSPKILALEVTETNAIVEALSRISLHFKSADE